MKKSEAFSKAQVAVLDSDMPISVKVDVLEILLWEEDFAKMIEECQAKKEAQAKEEANETL